MLGLALLALAFSNAIDYDHWLDVEVKYIISSREAKEFSKLQSDSERDHFIEDFWRRRDPVPATVLNEYREEHYRRLEYANDRYGDEGKPGWKTVRGQTYIIHGPPDDVRYSYGYLQRVSVSNPTNVLNPTGQALPFVNVEFPTPASETWVYHYVPGEGSSRTFFTVVFAKMEPSQIFMLESFIGRLSMSRAGGTATAVLASEERRRQRDLMILEFITKKDYFRNDYRIVYAGDPRFYDLEDVLEAVFDPRAGGRLDQFSITEATVDLLRSPGDLLERMWERRRRLEELVSSRVFFGTMDVDVKYAFLRDENGHVRIPFHTSVSLPSEGAFSKELDLTADLLLPQSQRVVASLQDKIRRKKDSKADSLTYQSRLAAPAGEYLFRFAISDLENQTLGLWEESLTVPDLNGTEFGASELLICEEVLSAKSFKKKDVSSDWVSSYRQWTPLAFDEYVFFPSLSQKFRRIQDLTTLVEIYSPSLVSNKPDVAVEAIFARNGLPVLSSFPKVLDYTTGDLGSIIYAFSLPLKRLDSGDYDFIVRITDQPTGKTIQRNTPVTIW